ncbi:DNA processing protein [Paenimyroides aquimaris]|uniref:DNA processing protein n=1 Tax=Paenimyroides marinum TaxID=1159016 RepID=A0A1H6JRB1_9FLAO|nr:DNA-processing protein DprA [Paenimyroides aquimaris]SEH61603.1 DNA processing protein [Paenimyroides aquimaris]
MNHQTLTSYLKLLACDGIGVLNARKLLDVFKDVNAIFDPGNQKIFEEFSVSKTIQKAILNFDKDKIVATELQFIQNNDIQWVGILDNAYPELLKECTDAPILLFYKGNLELLNNNCLAVVGTRKISSYGKDTVTGLMDFLQQYQPTIVSGMAYGVDITVYHEARKLNIPTVGIMGTSFKKLYPAAHRNFYNDLFENGLVLTEYAGFNTLAPELFTRRNRIIAGLCSATIVVESAETGGSLSTAYFANDYAREVYAVPGKITDPYSKGCLRLIHENRAQLLYNFEHLATDLNWNLSELKEKAEIKKEINLNDFSALQQTILKSLQKQPLHIDELAVQTHLDMSVLNAELMMLELNGIVMGLPGKIFKVK